MDRIHYNFENVSMIFAGPMAPNPSELLEEESFAELLKEKRQQYDYILIDTPPMMNIIDAAIVGKVGDGAVMVIESELVSYRMAQRVLSQLQKSGCRILGAVLNKVDTKRERYYSYYYSKYTK